MSELTLTGLRVLVEVARRGSFTATAEALGYTQSAISRQIGAAEDAAGGPLFERQARPSPAARAFVRALHDELPTLITR
ncbi:helix-turn-helix domain-containing protein [Saccharopolyspora gregorii]|uniref:helix-turn-helix domain-containing protein n=1 Tax=Saccharopolyspora gregorii TaxID=33914 RepID=UPI0021AC32AE|nr:LysR family transcriptional regulator [Saccharopolyspora gregorii]